MALMTSLGIFMRCLCERYVSLMKPLCDPHGNLVWFLLDHYVVLMGPLCDFYLPFILPVWNDYVTFMGPVFYHCGTIEQYLCWDLYGTLNWPVCIPYWALMLTLWYLVCDSYVTLMYTVCYSYVTLVWLLFCVCVTLCDSASNFQIVN